MATTPSAKYNLGDRPATIGKLGTKGYSTTISSWPLLAPFWSVTSPEPNRKWGGNTWD